MDDSSEVKAEKDQYAMNSQSWLLLAKLCDGFHLLNFDYVLE